MSNRLPSFSIIVPTYNRPAQLASCLETLAGLDYPRECFEVIVVDDGSTSPPGNIVEQFRKASDVKLFSQKNAGPAAARNFGATHARGEFLAFTDDDCAPDAGWLRAFASHFAANPDCLVGGRTLNALPYNIYSETSQLIIEVVYAHFNHDDRGARFFASNNFAIPARRFHEIDGFDEAFITSEDREICDRWLARGFRMTYAPGAVARHAHALTLRTLWRQHFGYGRGARRFHHARALRGDGRFRPDTIFYLKLLRAALSQSQKTRAAKLTSLLLWSQLANTAGFFYEKRRSRKHPVEAHANTART